MSFRILAWLVAIVAAVLVIPALVVGGAITFSFALPVLVLAVAALIVAKLYWDIKITRDLGANSSMNPREFVDPGVEEKPREQLRNRREK